MANERLTPEDKLLNIIENPSLVKKRRVGTPNAKPDNIERVKSWANSFWDEKKLLRVFKLKIIIKVLIGGCILLVIFLGIDFTRLRVERKNRLVKIETETYVTEKETEEPMLEAGLKESLREAVRRNIFSFLETRKDSAIKKDPIEPTKLFENLTLVGVIWSQTNPQVMIEDKQTVKTLLLSTDDMIGVFVVKEIKRDSVILEKDSKEWTLK